MIELYWYFNVFVIGACIGSFLNVVVARLPRGESIVHPPSHCACGERIAWYDNIPVFSWFILRGKCRKCRLPYSFRYPFVEFLTAAIFLGLWMVYPPEVAVALMIFSAFMISQAFIDLDTMEIPDVFSAGGFLLGLIAAIAVPALHVSELSGVYMIDALRSFVIALEGGFLASALILWVALTSEFVLRKEARGFGDVKLMGAIGAFCGWQGGVFALFGGAVLGTFAVLVGFLWKKVFGREAALEETEQGNELRDAEDEEEDGSLRIPFGPALGAGAVLYLLFFREAVADYFAQFAGIL